jgi:hypothetical protein
MVYLFQRFKQKFIKSIQYSRFTPLPLHFDKVVLIAEAYSRVTPLPYASLRATQLIEL